MKKIPIHALVLAASVQSSMALTASDNASNYGGSWSDLDNGGTGFNPWGFTTTASDTVEIADSTVGAGDINTGVDSFRIASDNGSIDVFRSFGSGATLAAGDVFSFDLSVNFRNGNKGFDLRNEGTGVFNFNVGGDNYFFGGTDLNAEGWVYVDDGVYSLEFEFVTETIMNAKITRTSGSDTTRSFEIPNVALSGAVDNFKFYVSGTDDDTENNSLYVNNLNVVPEPSAYALIFGALALIWATRRR